MVTVSQSKREKEHWITVSRERERDQAVGQTKSHSSYDYFYLEVVN